MQIHTGLPDFLFLLLCAMHITLYAVCGGLLLIRNREQRDRSRLFIGILLLSMAIGCAIFVSTALFRGAPTEFMETILEPYPTLLSFILYLFLLAYILEILRPNWINIPRVAHFLSPWLAIGLTFLIWHGVHGWEYAAITHMQTWNDVMANVHQPDVILRLCAAGLFFPYAVSTFFIRYDKNTSNASFRWLRWLQVLVLCVSCTFVFGMLMRILWVMLLHILLLDIITIIVMYIELRVRIPVPEVQAGTKENEPEKITTISICARHLKKLLDEGIWKNPDICREDVCEQLCTNRTYLAGAIHVLGYSGFVEMINDKRVTYIEQEISNDPTQPVWDIIFEAGYRNRTSAIKYFEIRYGVSPMDYANKKLDTTVSDK